jgi:hypothetical protein
MKSLLAAVLVAILMLIGYMSTDAFHLGSSSKLSRGPEKEVPQHIVQLIPPARSQTITRKIIDILNSHTHSNIPKISEESILPDGSMVVSIDIDSIAEPIDILTEGMRHDMVNTLKFLSSIGLSLDVATKRDLVDCFVVHPYSGKLSLVQIWKLKLGMAFKMREIIRFIDFPVQI